MPVTRTRIAGLLLSAVLLWAPPPALFAEGRFADLVGLVPVAEVATAGPLEVPYITWGGDVATFHANGGLRTKAGSVFDALSLDLQLRAGDDFVGQVKRYLSGKTPFLRGTFRMIGLASEVIGADPRTKGVVFLQLTWSAGDHLVGRSGVPKRLGELKGKTITLQKGGPHIGMLDDILGTASLGWSDVRIVWTDDLTGANGPAARFRKDSSVDACMVITPDMIGLTGGLDVKGSGAEGTVKGAHVVVSTAHMSRSIADVYVCRSDYFAAHRDTVEKFAAGYLQGCEEIIALRKDYEDQGRESKYLDVLQLTQSIYGKEVIPTLEVDADGLIADCRYVGLPGNRRFFEDRGFTEGFEAKQRKAIDLAVGQGYASIEQGFSGPRFDYDKIARLGHLKLTDVVAKERINPESPEILDDLELEENTLLSFEIGFERNQTEFSILEYGSEFDRAVKQATLFGNAVIAIRGHVDPTKTLSEFVKAGLEKGIIKRSGSPGSREYFYRGRPLDITDTAAIVDLVESGAFDGTEHNPRLYMQAALTLSRKRAEAVRDSIIDYARSKGLVLDASQIQPIGAGIREPLIPRPRTLAEAAKNMRVEFRLMKVPAEVINEADLDF